MAEPRRGLWLVPLLFVAGAAAVLWRDAEGGLPTLLELRSQVREARARVDALGMRAARLERDALALQSDDLAIEAAARTELGMVRPGEIVVRVGPPESR